MTKKDIKKIQFHYLHQSFYLPNRTALKTFILRLFKNEGLKVQEINYIFCSDEFLLGLNTAYLRHNTFTDIITFQYSEISQPILSDIYISIERVRENATLYKNPFIQELYRVMFHGALHLCNYGDKTKDEAFLMRKKENYYLDAYMVPRGTK